MIYEHYKGNRYTYICTAKKCDDAELEVIIYEDSSGQRWCRDSEEFFGLVQVNGQMIARFRQVI